jgi:hypothetical protein
MAEKAHKHTKSNPLILKKLKCFNCGENPLYFYDEEAGENCGIHDCEECELDKGNPHVVKHVFSGCPFGKEVRHTSKEKALGKWLERNKLPASG